MTRVAVTTDRFESVASEYADAGLEPVALPCIRIRPAPSDQMASARADYARADFALITSPRVVRLLWPGGGMPNVETAAIGPTTAVAVSNAGGRVGIVGDAGLARLVDLVEERLSEGRTIVVRAAESDAVAMTRLRRLAADLDDHVVYRTSSVPPGSDPVDAVAFASPSAVRGWRLTRGLDGLIVGAIGVTTSRAVAEYRVPHVIADKPSHRSLAEVIATFLAVMA